MRLLASAVRINRGSPSINIEARETDKPLLVYRRGVIVQSTEHEHRLRAALRKSGRRPLYEKLFEIACIFGDDAPEPESQKATEPVT